MHSRFVLDLVAVPLFISNQGQVSVFSADPNFIPTIDKMAGSKDAPQCILADQKGGGDAAAGVAIGTVSGVGADTMLATQFNRLEIAVNENDASMSSLSDDILFDILLFCGPTDVEDNLKLVNRRFQ